MEKNQAKVSKENLRFNSVYSVIAFFKLHVLCDYRCRINVWEGIISDNICVNLRSAFSGDWGICGLYFGMFPKFSS